MSKPKSGVKRPEQESAPAEITTAFEFFNEVGIIAQLSSKHMQRSLPHGLTQSQFSVLNWFIRVDNQATPGRLAKAFQVTGGAMTNTLGKLVEKGFVRVEPDPASGRSKIVTMTTAGRQARNQAITALEGDLAEFLGSFSSSRLQKSLPLLRDARAWLDEARN